jgi:hypothetical protein
MYIYIFFFLLNGLEISAYVAKLGILRSKEFEDEAI